MKLGNLSLGMRKGDLKAARRREDQQYGWDVIEYQGIAVTPAVAFMLARAAGLDRRSAERVSTDRGSSVIRLMPRGTVAMSYAEASAVLAERGMPSAGKAEVPALELTPTLR
jgi:hypothetical protein